MNLTEFVLNNNPIVLDGAMGTELGASGLEMGGQNNITNPQEVRSIHKQYAACGSQILITNTLTMNRIYIQTHNLNVGVREVNLAGAKLARSAAGNRHYVLGDISSTGRLLEPYGDLKEKDASAAFREQAYLLAEGGVDGFIVETMIDLRETICAVQACKSISALPVIASMSFGDSNNGGHTIMGNSAKACAEQLTDAGALALGTNCGNLNPAQMASVVAELCKETCLPVLAMPNAGLPKLVENRTVFDMSPDAFAGGVAECLNAGARLVGGCCGTTPEHISAVKEMLHG
jgi:5-methyltetrahydrofolate--homocysteine methyltransferase